MKSVPARVKMIGVIIRTLNNGWGFKTDGGNTGDFAFNSSEISVGRRPFLLVTVDSPIPTEGITWSTIKAVYEEN